MLRALAIAIGLGTFGLPALADHLSANDQKILADFLKTVPGNAFGAEDYLGKAESCFPRAETRLRLHRSR